MKNILFKKKNEFIKLPLWIIILLLAGVSPILIGKLAIIIYEFITNKNCTTHGGECFGGVISWFVILTAPVSILIFTALLIISIIDFFLILKKRK